MPSMRSVPGEPADQMNALLRLLLPFARQSIVASGELDPLGASMATDGELETAQGVGDPAAALADIRAGFRERARRGELIAAGACSAVALDEGDWPGGVRIELEHRDAQGLTLVHPYRRSADGDTTWGEAFRLPWEGRIWEVSD